MIILINIITPYLKVASHNPAKVFVYLFRSNKYCYYIILNLYLQLFHWAQRNADHIVPLYCFDPRHYTGTYYYNLPKTGPFRLHFLLDSIRDLRNTLLNKGR